MKIYPKKLGGADWHPRGQSLERKKRCDSRQTNPVCLGIWVETEIPCVQFRSHCNQNARFPDSQSPDPGFNPVITLAQI